MTNTLILLTGARARPKQKGEVESKERKGPLHARKAAMKFKSGVINLILVAGIFTVASYGTYGGSIRPAAGIRQEILAGPGSGSLSGLAAGGPARINKATDCRSCARKGQP
jgi:hypothetical protein